MMRQAMLAAKRNNCLIVAHCEDESLIAKGACIHAGRKAEELGFTGISSASEYQQIERDLRLAEETGCQYHICHISCKESVALVRQAKQRGAGQLRGHAASPVIVRGRHQRRRRPFQDESAVTH